MTSTSRHIPMKRRRISALQLRILDAIHRGQVLPLKLTMKGRGWATLDDVYHFAFGFGEHWWDRRRRGEAIPPSMRASVCRAVRRLIGHGLLSEDRKMLRLTDEGMTYRLAQANTGSTTLTDKAEMAGVSHA